MLYIAWMIILSSQDLKKISKTSILELYRVNNCIMHQQVVYCTTQCTHVSHYWQKQSFRVFYTGHDRPWGRLEAAKTAVLYPSRQKLS